MHKQEASYLFSLLSDGDRVKIIKVLYNNDEVPYAKFNQIVDCDKNTLDTHLSLLVEGNLLVCNQSIYKCNKELVDELMEFVKKPCGCCNLS